MIDTLALMTVIAWPIIPLFWIPVHLMPGLFRKIGLITYVIIPAIWIPVALLIYQNRELILSSRIEISQSIRIGGSVLLILGTVLHIWTGKLLSLPGITGVPEIVPEAKGRFVADGAFAFVRHPTYLAHTMMFSGVFFITGVTSVGIVAVTDFLVVYLFVIPLEERELETRFGKDYSEYKKSVPKFFPTKLR